MSTASAASGVGPLLRDWRVRRRRSQQDLALDAGVSARHLSFVETGRSRPSADMVLHLAEQLEVPLRDRNALLLAAGHAPAYAEHDLDAPELAGVRDTMERLLRAHEPAPALVVDRHWELVAGNRTVGLLIEGVDPDLLAPPLNVLRITLHPDGLASRIENLAELRPHLLDRLRAQAVFTGDPALAALHDELEGYPGPDRAHEPPAGPEIAVSLTLRDPGGARLRFISTLATFGIAAEVTASELAIETFFPADAETAARLTAYAASLPPG
ncbi:MAG: helix-turn-helix domain-containing protein [Baekduiaceae bacterium]